MTRFPIYGSAQPVDPVPNEATPEPVAKQAQPASFTEGVPSNGAPALEPHDLEAALQLLVERAQYITGATGAALALAQEGNMVCRASAGTCAPPVGARLQVQSGLTGESVARKQLLRCDNAENDPRVNLETCQQLGIASIVVLPLLSSKGEVRGLFELFSDHAYAFEERDLTALERMAELTRTALDLAEKTTIVIPSREAKKEAAPSSGNEPETDISKSEIALAEPSRLVAPVASVPAVAESSKEAESQKETEPQPVTSLPPVATQLGSSATELVSQPSLPPAMQRIQKCSSCGFPVSEGRTLCVDCEEKRHREPEPPETMPAEFVPSFGISSSEAPAEESWLANHVNILAILVLILSILVAVVVFR
jgi:putative methionine-R-sulfoxide reductase with GAF domain